MSHDVASIGRSVPVERLQAITRQNKQPNGQPNTATTLTPTLTHTVVSGETLSGIAEKYKANKPADMDMDTWITTIQVTNGLADRHAIKIGQVLNIPQLVAHGETLE